jgi:hypothetical protein
MRDFSMDLIDDNGNLVVHFMQPHYPFLTDETEFDKGHLENAGTDEGNVWAQLLEGTLDVDESTVISLYDENLRRVLPSVERLLDELPGKTVVTADHGNMLGERARPIPIREWGHPRGIYTPELVTVPWLVVDGETRRDIVAEQGVEDEDGAQEDVVKERLRELGYAE